MDDPQLNRLIETETKKARFRANVLQFTDTCWDKCIDKISNSMDIKTEQCVANCVERFMDTADFVVNKFNK